MAPTIWQQTSLAIGHATDTGGGTGCTVIRGVDAPFRCAAALVGRGSGTRELATAHPEHLVDRTDAILLTGGSAYGLDAAAGIMRWMEERGRGFSVGAGVVPIVPAAVLFDLSPIGRFDARPDAAMAYAACDNASTDDVQEGAVGAGTGALVGKAAGIDAAMKGGVGIAEHACGSVRAGALAVVNALGDVRDSNGRIVAGARDANGHFLDAVQLFSRGNAIGRFENASRGHTTLCVVAVNVVLDRQSLWQVARAATAAIYRRITPAGTQFDGDVVFAVCPYPAATAGDAHAESAAVLSSVPPATIEVAAAQALEQAIERGVRTARGRDGFPGLADT